MIYQTDKEFPPDIFHWGCYMMCILERICTRFGFPFTHEWVFSFYRDGTNAKFITTEDFVDKPQQFANLALQKGWKLAEDVAQGMPSIKYLGKFGQDHVCGPDDLEIQCWHTAGTDFNHFMSAQDGKVVYDPWSAGGSATALTGKCIGKRVFRVIA